MRRQRYGRVGCLIGLLVLALAVSPVHALAGVGGGLVQLAGTAGCLSGETTTPSGCAAVRALRGGGRLAVSPDGKNVYAPARDADAVVAFDRHATTGALTQKNTIAGCYSTDAAVVADDGCSLASATPADLDGPAAVAVSPDGANVYVATASGHLTGFNRASDGTLSFNDSHSVADAGGSGPFASVAVSPDGTSVYPVSSVSGSLFMVYRRDTGPARRTATSPTASASARAAPAPASAGCPRSATSR
jgi:DNA-binding beta-propeller fold protein YncE